MGLRALTTTLPAALLLTVCMAWACQAQQPGASAQQTGMTRPGASARQGDANAASSMRGQVLDVFASNNKSGAPDLTLRRDDVELLDEGRAVPDVALHTPADAGRRPIVLWIVVQCVMPGTTSDGSGFLRKYTMEIASGLTRLGPGEAYGVAHWCDDGASALDLPPNRRIAQLGPTLAGILAPTVTPPTSGLPGEDALLKVVQDTIAATSQYRMDAEPVLLFLYGDHSAAPDLEVNAILRKLIAAPAVVFLVNDGLAKPPSAALGEVSRVIGNLADRTGGGYFHVPFGDTSPFLYAQAIASVIDRMHARYQLSWMPQKQDGDEHMVTVRLSAAAKKSHPGLELRYRTAYETVRQPAEAVQTSR